MNSPVQIRGGYDGEPLEVVSDKAPSAGLILGVENYPILHHFDVIYHVA